MVYLVKTPSLVKPLFKSLIWNFKEKKDSVFLTFDDGPHPVITPQVLDILNEYNAKATFFCVGDNVKKYPDIYQRILDEEHTVGNHTYNHLNAFKTNHEIYIENVKQCTQYVNSSLFRPPYGKLKRKQIIALKDYFNIIMWDVLSGDFDAKVTPKKCLNNVLKYIKGGSIVVFHDSEKAKEKMLYALPEVLNFIKNNKLKAVSISYEKTTF